MKINLKFFILAFAAIVLDQVSKILFFSLKHSGGFITPLCNKNIAWSLPIGSGFFYPLWIVIIIFIFVALSKAENSFSRAALTMVLAGAFSNIIDRLTRGCVADFIDLKFWPASNAFGSNAGWPVFNLADIYITIGVIIFFMFIFKSKFQNPNAKSSPKLKI